MDQICLWFSAQEVLFKNEMDKRQKWCTYKDLITKQAEEFKILNQDSLEAKGIKLGWLQYRQLHERFKIEIKNQGVTENRTELEEILLGKKKKQ